MNGGRGFPDPAFQVSYGHAHDVYLVRRCERVRAELREGRNNRALCMAGGAAKGYAVISPRQ